MSAFMVSTRHIDAIVTLARLHRCSNVPDAALVGPNDLTEGDVVGQRLIAENRASINHRYPDTVGKLDAEPGPIPHVMAAEEYRYRGWRGPLPTAVEGLKLVRCYAYQTCEHPGWPDSFAFALCERLTSHLVSALPGYSEAPWEWS